MNSVSKITKLIASVAAGAAVGAVIALLGIVFGFIASSIGLFIGILVGCCLGITLGFVNISRASKLKTKTSKVNFVADLIDDDYSYDIEAEDIRFGIDEVSRHTERAKNLVGMGQSELAVSELKEIVSELEEIGLTRGSVVNQNG